MSVRGEDGRVRLRKPTSFCISSSGPHRCLRNVYINLKTFLTRSDSPGVVVRSCPAVSRASQLNTSRDAAISLAVLAFRNLEIEESSKSDRISAATEGSDDEDSSSNSPRSQSQKHQKPKKARDQLRKCMGSCPMLQLVIVFADLLLPNFHQLKQTVRYI